MFNYVILDWNIGEVALERFNSANVRILKVISEIRGSNVFQHKAKLFLTKIST